MLGENKIKSVGGGTCSPSTHTHHLQSIPTCISVENINQQMVYLNTETSQNQIFVLVPWLSSFEGFHYFIRYSGA